MALVHNTFIRGPNTLYLQAPYIPPSSATLVADFFTYCTCWCALVAVHHKHEEEFLFSAFEERIPAAKGILEVNVGQHDSFHAELKPFEEYCTEALARKVAFSAKEILQRIDAMAPALLKHLREEIPTLMAMQEGGSGEEVLKIHEEFEKRVRSRLDVVRRQR